MIQFLFFFALIFSPVAQCWGQIGHRAVGYLALKHLSPAGRDLYEKLILRPGSDFDISDGAVWADDHKRGRWEYTAPWHYINGKDYPPKTCGVISFENDCPKKTGCIVSAIKNMTARVNDINLPHKDQSNALKFLLHFLGDIHQPLHTEHTCRGGTHIMVDWNDETVNLHAVWDSEIIKKLLQYRGPNGKDPKTYDKVLAKDWAHALDDDSTIRVGDAGGATDCVDVTDPVKCAVAWANEANTIVCSYVLQDGSKGGSEPAEGDPGEEKCDWVWNGPADLEDEYYDGAVPIVKMQVKKAGLRLAAWINGIAAQRATLMNGGPGLKVQGQGEWEL